MRYLRILCLAFVVMFFLSPLSACGTVEALAPAPETAAPNAEEPDLNAEEPTEPAPEPEPEPAPEPEFVPEPKEARAEYIRVLADGLNVRASAGGTVLGQAEKGVLLSFCGKTGDWYETRWRGKPAFVSAAAQYTQRCSLPAAKEEIEKVVRAGEALLGTPYVYGAVRLHDGKGRLLSQFTETKFDCSSLTQFIFYRGAGILLDVTTRTQIVQGTHVDDTELARGDLMFFTNASRKDKTGIERVGHVALYLGEGYILHTASDFAKIEPLSPLRKSYFLEARRML